MTAPLWDAVARAGPPPRASRRLHSICATIYGQRFPDYWSLWRWSIANKESFWRELWDFCGIIGEQGARALIDGHLMPGARWFPDAQLNFAENLLKSAAVTTRWCSGTSMELAVA